MAWGGKEGEDQALSWGGEVVSASQRERGPLGIGWALGIPPRRQGLWVTPSHGAARPACRSCCVSFSCSPRLLASEAEQVRSPPRSINLSITAKKKKKAVGILMVY